MNPLSNPGVRTAIAAALASIVVFYFPKMPADQASHWLELALTALAGWLVRAPGDGLKTPLTPVKPADAPVTNPRPAGE